MKIYNFVRSAKCSSVSCVTKMSKLSVFRTPELYSREDIWKSPDLMLHLGFIYPSSFGIYTILPFTLRAMEKLCSIVDKEMKKIDGQKIILPILSSANMWKKSGRWDSFGSALYKVQGSDSEEFCLGPTHEEEITSLVASLNKLSYKQLPLKLYQITQKFRNEKKPRCGLLRGNEFWMKDMYCFDRSDTSAKETYNEVCHAYDRVFKCLGIPPVKVQAVSGDMGGSLSNEYHYLTDAGEDNVLICLKCNTGMNKEFGDFSTCSNCGSELIQKKGIEVGHAFLLGTVYSKLFNAHYIDDKGKNELLHMSCFGLGITRVLAASVEVLSSPDNIKWPLTIAPYLFCVIIPKKGSKEEKAAHNFISSSVLSLCTISYVEEDMVIDDRTQFTIGFRINEAKSLGFPYLIVFGKKVLEDIPKIEVHDVYRNEQYVMVHLEMMNFVKEIYFSVQKLCK